MAQALLPWQAELCQYALFLTEWRAGILPAGWLVQSTRSKENRLHSGDGERRGQPAFLYWLTWPDEERDQIAVAALDLPRKAYEPGP